MTDLRYLSPDVIPLGKGGFSANFSKYLHKDKVKIL